MLERLIWTLKEQCVHLIKAISAGREARTFLTAHTDGRQQQTAKMANCFGLTGTTRQTGHAHGRTQSGGLSEMSHAIYRRSHNPFKITTPLFTPSESSEQILDSKTNLVNHVMEKHRPHYPLVTVKALISEGRVRATVSAFTHAQMIGVHDLAGMCSVILSLGPSNFYKSMTTHADHRIWQDVYHAFTPSGDPVYLKLTVLDDVLIISFKEL